MRRLGVAIRFVLGVMTFAALYAVILLVIWMVVGR